MNGAWSVDGIKSLVIDLIGQLGRGVIGCLSIKPWCYWPAKTREWCVSMRLVIPITVSLLFLYSSFLGSFSQSIASLLFSL